MVEGAYIPPQKELDMLEAHIPNVVYMIRETVHPYQVFTTLGAFTNKVDAEKCIIDTFGDLYIEEASADNFVEVIEVTVK